MLHFFWYRKWPSEASNHQNFPLRGLHEGCALSGARNIFIALGAARQKCRFFTKTGSKVPFLQGFAGLHPLYRRAGPPDLKKSTWCHPQTGRAGVRAAPRGRGGCCSFREAAGHVASEEVEPEDRGEDPGSGRSRAGHSVPATANAEGDRGANSTTCCGRGGRETKLAEEAGRSISRVRAIQLAVIAAPKESSCNDYAL